MKVRILFFATLKDRAGRSRLDLEIAEQATVDDVRQALIAQFPDMDVNLIHSVAAVNQEFATDTDVLRDGDEVAFFPPVSGGSNTIQWPELFQLPHEAVDHDAVIAAITTPQTGAIALFSGIVRGETSQIDATYQTTHLEYEAYEPMAESKMRQVAAEIRERWPRVQGIAIIQRLGKLTVGQNTVLIACSAAHRNDGCFEAARYGIDRLKEIVPIWKKEISGDGASWVEGGYYPGAADRRE
ncbi:MAG: molybdopterin converting factor subunit 1 [Chloroflexota bacterium]